MVSTAINRNTVIFGLFLLAFVIISMLSLDLPFFWDAISKSKRAQWILDNNFSSVILPADYDSGHPPLFLLYLAGFWTVFGKTLAISHLAMLPFLLGIGYQLILYVKKYLPEKYFPACFLLILLEPTFLAQMTNMHTDIILVFFYFLGMNAIHSGKKSYILLSIIGLTLINIRGMVMAFSLFMTDLYLHYHTYKFFSRSFIHRVVLYSLALLPLLGWLFYHYNETGWILFTPSENWSAQRQQLGVYGMLRNIVVIIKNLLDFGRITMWLISGILVIHILKKKMKIPAKSAHLFLQAAIPFLLLSLSFIPFSNPIGHRYFMIIYLLGIILMVHKLAMMQHLSLSKIYIIVILIAVSFISGHFWVYPDKISQGWDSSLAHLPYFELRKKMNTYIKKNDIQINQTGTAFPYASEKYTDLKDDGTDFPEYDFYGQTYIIQSNIMNDFSDEEIDRLKNRWQLVKEYKKMNVYIRLYKREKDL